MNVELVMRLDERFNGPDMMKKRQKAAQAIVDKSKQNRDLDDVLDFFETTGLLLKKGALEREMVWNTFYYWITGYYQSAVSYISSQAEGDPETYAELKYLYDEMISIEKHRCKCSYSDLVLSDQDIKDFLIDELSD